MLSQDNYKMSQEREHIETPRNINNGCLLRGCRGSILEALRSGLEGLRGILRVLKDGLEILQGASKAMLSQDSSMKAHGRENIEDHLTNKVLWFPRRSHGGSWECLGNSWGVSWRHLKASRWFLEALWRP